MSAIQANQSFGYLTTIRRRRRNDRSEWLCLCVCGKRKWIPYTSLQGAVRPVKSCGCMRIRLLRKARTTHGCSVRTSSGFPTFVTWQSMIWRCYNKARDDYQDYGGRGITVCKRWMQFHNFLADMGMKPSGMSLGRMNNDAGYSLANCRWETPSQQARNTRANTILYFKGANRTLVECSEISGIKSDTIGRRLKLGWSVTDALTRKVAAHG